MNDQVFDKVRRLASELFDVPAGDITAESSPAALENWDSVQHLNLVLALEEEFGVKFEPEDMEKMQSIGQAVQVVSSKLPNIA
jgi:acyl carrier protein